MAMWNRCAICGKSIPVGELCYGVKNWRGDPIGGDTICRDCLVPENAPTLTPPNEPLTLEQLRASPHGKIKDSTLQSICNRANEIACRPPEGRKENIDCETD